MNTKDEFWPRQPIDSFSDKELSEELEKARRIRAKVTSKGYRTLMRYYERRVLAILDEMHSRAIVMDRRHVAPERGRGRVGDTENGR